MRLAVAATAPFGADVLERLAARHEIAYLLTRPDAPRGRGRKLAPTPTKEVAERLGIPVHQPEKPALPDEPVDTIVICAYGLLVPQSLLDQALWLNVHPSLLPRWRGAAPVERSILAGDEETGVTIHETVAALDAGPIAAQETFPIGPDDDAGTLFARSAEVAARLLDQVLPTPVFEPQPEDGVTYAEKIAPADRELNLDDPHDAWLRVRALSPHIGAWTTLHGRRVTIWRARLDDGAFVPVEVQPEGKGRMPYDAFIRGVRGVIAPARRAAYEVVRRVFEDEAYADRALTAAAAGLDSRDRALAQRIAYGTVQRVRTIDHGIDELGRRPVRKLDPAVLAALRVAGYELAWSDAAAYAVADDAVELVRAAGLERAVGFTNAVARRLAEGFPAFVAALPDGPLKESYPDWVWETWVRDWGEEEALALGRAQNEPAELVVRSESPVGEATDVPGAWHVARVDPELLAAGRIWPQSRGSQVAALAVASQDGERVLDACAAPGGKATMLRGDVTAVEVHAGRARELEANARRLGATNVRVVNVDVRELDESGFDRALVDAPCSGLGVLARRPDLRWRGKPLPELQLELLRAAAERVRPGGTVVYSVCTLNADENEAVVDAIGLEPEPLGADWPQFAHPKRPEFLLTTPHRHGTSGFFIARVRV